MTYIKSLEINNFKIFSGNNAVNFFDEDGNPYLWNIILGNNNTGKTTLLRILAGFDPIELKIERPNKKSVVIPRGFSTKLRNYFATENDWNFSCEFYGQDSFSSFNWGFGNRLANTIKKETINNFTLFGYGINRKSGNSTIVQKEQNNVDSIFSLEIDLTNIEEWIMQTKFALNNGNETAKDRLEKIGAMIVSGILPDVKGYEIITDKNLNNYVTFLTDFGKRRLEELGYGYQTSISWIFDLAKKMFDKFPDSENPLHESAVVLVDEIDLHIHPEWQRNLTGYLSAIFPNIQFIATTHSPLIIQSAEKINLILLEKEEDHIKIVQSRTKSFKGWTVEEILDEIMGLDEKTQSDFYIDLIKRFEVALGKSDYESAVKLFNQLDTYLHPNNPQRKLLRIQLSSITPPPTDDKVTKKPRTKRAK